MAAAEDCLRRRIDYEPRAQFLPFHLRDKRWAIIVAHRRAGKTVACVMELLTRALATAKKDARYAYIAPFREQAKNAAWAYLKHFAAPVVRDPSRDFRESELAVRLPNAAQVRVYGADNPNALRGIYLDGAVMDEHADMRPSLWGEVIRPTLSDRKGWAVFIGTPRGHNDFYDLYQDARRQDDWYHLMLRASETGILPADELASARRQMTPAQYDQEYECSFEAAILGAVYPKELKEAEPRIMRLPHDGAHLVHTAWDIGHGDATAIWFWQEIAGEIRVIDYFEASGEKAPFYLSVLKGRGYNYDTAWLPHDAAQERITGLSFADVMKQNGVNVQVLPRLSLEEGINAARMIFSRCYFDAERCAHGLEALRAYQWAYNERMGESKSVPLHNWASHGADAFRYLAQATAAQQSSVMVRNLPKVNYGRLPVV